MSWSIHVESVYCLQKRLILICKFFMSDIIRHFSFILHIWQGKHREPSGETLFPTFCRIFDVLPVEWRNSTPPLVPAWYQSEEIKILEYYIHNCCVTLCPFGTTDSRRFEFLIKSVCTSLLHVYYNVLKYLLSSGLLIC